MGGREIIVEVLFHGGRFPAAAVMGLDGAQQVFASAIVEEEDPLPQTPQRGRAELVSTGAALGDVVSQD